MTLPVENRECFWYNGKGDYFVVTWDIGHSKGPGATDRKAKVSSGTQGKWTGVAEYKLNLEVSLQLRDALLAEGYNVIMIRETNEVDIANSERAAIANESNADVFIRIHANGSENQSAQGMLLGIKEYFDTK